MFVGLVKDPGREWRPPDDDRGPGWSVPWGLLLRTAAWVALVAAMFAAVPFVDDLIGHLAGYVLILLTVSVSVWRVNRWFERQYWRGLQDY